MRGKGRLLVWLRSSISKQHLGNDACNFRATLPTPHMNACINTGAKVRIQHVRNRLWREFLTIEDQPNPGSISVREPSRVFVYSEVPFGNITQSLKHCLTRHVSSSSWTIKIQSLMKKMIKARSREKRTTQAYLSASRNTSRKARSSCIAGSQLKQSKLRRQFKGIYVPSVRHKSPPATDGKRWVQQ
jgi:hypothetical protein